jgi:hypothetical protein
MFGRHLNPQHSFQVGVERAKSLGKIGVIPFVPPKPGQVFKVGMPNPNAVKSSIERAK